MGRNVKRQSWHQHRTGLAIRRKVTPNDDPYGVWARLVQELQDAGKRVDDYDATMVLARAGLLRKPDGQKRAAKKAATPASAPSTESQAKVGDDG